MYSVLSCIAPNLFSYEAFFNKELYEKRKRTSFKGQYTTHIRNFSNYESALKEYNYLKTYCGKVVILSSEGKSNQRNKERK